MYQFRQLAKLRVAGSNPVFRSKNSGPGQEIEAAETPLTRWVAPPSAPTARLPEAARTPHSRISLRIVASLIRFDT
jgi:hypothetical protein